MKNRPHIQPLVAVMAIVMLLAVNVCSVYAADREPDLQKEGSISITLTDKKKDTAVTGGEITLYQVASAVMEDGTVHYQYVNGFENCGISLDDLEDSELAGNLERKLSASAEGVTKTVDGKGTVRYTDLSAGIYLLVQTKASEGYDKIDSFIATLPLKMDGVWVYDVDASPKVGTVTAVQPDTPKNSGTSKNQNLPDRLPQTGQLDWPVPVLSIAGLLLFSTGWMLRRSKKA